MTVFTWIGGNLSNAASWIPQPLPPNPPVVPGSADYANLGGAGALKGSLNVIQAELTGSFDLTGSIFSSGASILDSGALTIENGASFGGGGVALGLKGAASVVLAGGTVSASVSSVTIDHGSTFALKSGALSATGATEGEILGSAAGSGSITQTGGTNSTTFMLLHSGAYRLNGGTLSVGVSGEYVADTSGLTATFTQNGGTHTIDSFLSVGFGADGAFYLNKGSLSCNAQFIGQNGVGDFTQSGGTQTVADRIVLGIDLTGGGPGSGDYGLSGGTLHVQTIFLGSDPGCSGRFFYNDLSGNGELFISGTGGFPGLIVGGEGTGKFVHGYGSLDTTLVVGFRATGIGTYNQSGGQLTSTGEVVGGSGAGFFNQSAGTNTISGAGLVIGSESTATGSYEMGSDTPANLVANREIVGGAGTGTFSQEGVSNNNTKSLDIGAKGSGTYFLHDKDSSLHATQELVGDRGHGVLTQQAGSNVIKGTLDVGVKASGNGRYTLDDGVLNAGNEIIGDAGHAQFNQFGGNNNIYTNLTIGNADHGVGAYNLNGGKLNLTAKNGSIFVAVTPGSEGALTLDHGAATTTNLVIGAKGSVTTAETDGIVTVARAVTMSAGSKLDSTVGSVDIGDGLTTTPGTIQVGSGGTLSGAGTILGAFVETAKGTVTATGGVLYIAGDISGGGKLRIDDGATLDLGGSDSNTVVFAGGAGILKLEHPDTFTGKLTVHVGDIIDLVGFTATSVSVQSGVLKVKDDVGVVLAYHLAGDLGGGHFTFHDDGAGGTDLVLEAATPEHLDGADLVLEAAAAEQIDCADLLDLQPYNPEAPPPVSDWFG